MNYRVLWSDEAAGRLVGLLAAHDAAAVARAAERLDAALGYCPEQVGESRAAGERIGFESPLAVTYTVDQEAREVRITNVWAPPRRV